MGEDTVVTSVAPVTTETRDRLKRFKHDRGHPNYNAALADLLDEVAAE